MIERKEVKRERERESRLVTPNYKQKCNQSYGPFHVSQTLIQKAEKRQQKNVEQV
jgi:hypothetical protein